MANNHMWIECEVCGGRHILAKHFGGPWELRVYKDGDFGDDTEFVRQLEDWLGAHTYCGDYESNGTRLRLVYEHSPDPAREVKP